MDSDIYVINVGLIRLLKDLVFTCGLFVNNESYLKCFMWDGVM
jgi:hypothetical protein